MKTKSIFVLIAVMAVFIACSEDKVRAPYGSGKVPGNVEVKSVENTAGGAIIKYTLPQGSDVLYVKAEFKSGSGEIREVRASTYVDSVIITGLGSTERMPVKLYAVNKVEQASSGIEVDIEPLTPPIMTVRASLAYEVDWGGFSLAFDNPDKAPVLVYVYYQNEDTQSQELHDIIYTEQRGGVLRVSDLKDTPTDFTLYVTDRWDNWSEPLEFSLTPRREDELDVTKFKEMFITGDVRWYYYSGAWANLWDNTIGAWNYAHTNFPVPFPHPMTIDLGCETLLSRIKFWQRDEEADFYAHGTPRHFQVWGCTDNNDARNPDKYVLMMDTYLDKPSGGGFTDPNTAEDILAAKQGHTFWFEDPDNQPVVRYIQFISLASWSGIEATRIAEMKFWGQIEK